MNELTLAVEKDQQNSQIEIPKVNVIETEDWERVKFPNVPRVDKPTVVRQQVPLPEGSFPVPVNMRTL